MRYTYKVRELKPHTEESVDVGEAQEMQAMSLKKLQRKLDPKKKYFIVYIPINEKKQTNRERNQWQIQLNTSHSQFHAKIGNNWVTLQIKQTGQDLK